jgi:Na+/melibiose symporter-like transporter
MKLTPARLSAGDLAAFAGPSVALATLGAPLQIYIPPFFAGHMGLGLVTVGLIFSAMRFWDLAATPLVGGLCDRTVGRWGRRRFWTTLATPLVVLATAAVFMPPTGAGAVYLMVAAFTLYTSVDLFSLSYSAWSAEVSGDYHERSRVQTARQGAGVAGLLLILILPLAAVALHPHDAKATRVAIMGAFLVLFLPLTVGAMLWRTPEPPAAPPAPPLPWAEGLTLLARNRALQIILAITLIEGVGFGVINSMFVFLTEDVWRLGGLSTLALLAYIVSGLVFLAPVLWISRRLGKHRTAFCTTLVTMLSLPVMLLVPPAAPVLAIAGCALMGVTQLGVQSLYGSMMADIVDADHVDGGRSRAGFVFSIYAMSAKVGGAVAIGAGYAVLHAVGFHPGGHNDAATLTGFKLACFGPPILIEALVAALIWRYPLTEARQRAHREVLSARAAAAPPGNPGRGQGEKATG